MTDPPTDQRTDPPSFTIMMQERIEQRYSVCFKQRESLNETQLTLFNFVFRPRYSRILICVTMVFDATPLFNQGDRWEIGRVNPQFPNKEYCIFEETNPFSHFSNFSSFSSQPYHDGLTVLLWVTYDGFTRFCASRRDDRRPVYAFLAGGLIIDGERKVMTVTYDRPRHCWRKGL